MAKDSPSIRFVNSNRVSLIIHRCAFPCGVLVVATKESRSQGGGVWWTVQTTLHALLEKLRCAARSQGHGSTMIVFDQVEKVQESRTHGRTQEAGTRMSQLI
jgi:hypothetical protein